MKIVFMGTPDFAVGALDALLKAGHEVTAVVTKPDKESGRDRKVQASPVKKYAQEHGLMIFQPTKIKAQESVIRLRQYEADIFVVAAYGQILSKEILEMPKYGCINIHASLLPKYRGAAPIQWAILNGDEVTGVTIMQMDEGLDTGDILAAKEVLIEQTDTGESLFDKLSAAGAELLVETLPLIEAGKISPVEQDEGKATHVKMLTKEMGKIDWNRDAAALGRLVRGMNSWPSAYCGFRGKTLKIWKAEVSEEPQKVEKNPVEEALHSVGRSLLEIIVKEAASAEKPHKPGEVLSVAKDSITVQTGNGSLILKEVQLEGKRRMPVYDFLLGYPVKEGEILS